MNKEENGSVCIDTSILAISDSGIQKNRKISSYFSNAYAQVSDVLEKVSSYLPNTGLNLSKLLKWSSF